MSTCLSEAEIYSLHLFSLMHVSTQALGHCIFMIGFFDSGFGGLTALRRVVEALPHFDYLYLGDNARARPIP